jgi:hypothetical protein
MSEFLSSGKLFVYIKKWWTARAIFSANLFMLKYLQRISDTQNKHPKIKEYRANFCFGNVDKYLQF